MTKTLAILFFCATLISYSLAQDKPKTPIENLTQAIKLLEFDFSENGITYPTNSPLAKKAEKKQQEMMEIQNRLMAIHLIQEAIKVIETEKARVRVITPIPP